MCVAVSARNVEVLLGLRGCGSLRQGDLRSNVDPGGFGGQASVKPASLEVGRATGGVGSCDVSISLLAVSKSDSREREVRNNLSVGVSWTTITGSVEPAADVGLLKLQK